MKFYSEKLRAIYDTPELLEEAEKKHEVAIKAKEEKLTEKKARVEEVQQAYVKIKEAESEFIELKNKFVKDYGQFYMEYTNSNARPLVDVFDMFNTIFRGWPW